MRKLKKYWIITIGIGIVLTVIVVVFSNRQIKQTAEYSGIQESNTHIIDNSEANPTIKQRLRSIEPDQAITIHLDWRREEMNHFLEQNELRALQDFYDLGHKVAYEIIREDVSWVRPVYSEYWHTTFMGGKYSNIIDIISYAQRSFFVYTGGLSEGAGLYYHLGFNESSGAPISSFNASESFELLSINHKITEIIQLDNQWLVIVEPQLQGYQTARINYDDTDIRKETKEELQVILFRFVTPDGYELERTTGILPVH